MNKNANISEILTVNDIIKRYHMSKDKAYELVHSKDFPSFKIKGKFYVRADLLDKWENNQIYIRSKGA